MFVYYQCFVYNNVLSTINVDYIPGKKTITVELPVELDEQGGATDEDLGITVTDQVQPGDPSVPIDLPDPAQVEEPAEVVTSNDQTNAERLNQIAKEEFQQGTTGCLQHDGRSFQGLHRALQ